MPALINSTTPESEKDLWRTNPVLFKLLDREFNFHLDAAASAENALCSAFYTEQDNALVQPWTILEEGIWRVFVNPPFSMAGEFLAKADEEVQKGALVVALIRADGLETKWFGKSLLDRSNPVGSFLLQLKYQVRILVPRTHYLLPDGTKPKHGANFPSAVVVMDSGFDDKCTPGVFWWNWKEEAIAQGLMEK